MSAETSSYRSARTVAVARVLLVDDHVASRLTLQAVLRAGGYSVDLVSSVAEAVSRMDENQYELVLSVMHLESPESGLEVLAHAKLMDYEPAIGILTRYQDPVVNRSLHSTLVESQDLPGFLDNVADLISQRAVRMVEALS